MKIKMKEILNKIIVGFDIIQFLVASTVFIVFAGVVYSLIYVDIPTGNKEALIHVLGIIEGGVIAIVSFYFGSSKGSQKKSDTIDKLSEK